MSSPAKIADFESFLVDCSTKTCCGRQVSSVLRLFATRHPHLCLPISKLFQERASSPINFIFIDRFSSLRFRILIYTELELYASTIWLFCVHLASRDAGSCFRRRFIDRSDFFFLADDSSRNTTSKALNLG